MDPSYQLLLNQIKKAHDEYQEPTHANEQVLIIDGTNTFIRAYSAQSAINVDGRHISGITGFLKSIGYAIRLLRPTRTIILFDGKGGSKRRRKLYPEYKAHRKSKYSLNRLPEFKLSEDDQSERDSMIAQSIRVIEYLHELPITLISIDNIEADDVIAYLTAQLFKDNKVDIMSTDQDFLQLINDNVSVWSPTKKKRYTMENFVDEYEIHPNNFLLYRIMKGDKSDNISGVKGIGMKTVQKRLPFLMESSSSTIDEILKVAEEKQDVSIIYKRLLESKDKLFLNYDLMQLHNVDISANAKFKIMHLIETDISRINKAKFQVMCLSDQLHQQFPTIRTWLLQTFNRLDHFAELHNNKENYDGEK